MGASSRDRRGGQDRRSGKDRRELSAFETGSPKIEQDKGTLQALYEPSESDPDFAKAWNTKGSAFVKLKRYGEAKEAFNKAIEIQPAYAPGWYNLAMVYSIEGRKEEALSKLKKAIEIDASFSNEAPGESYFKKLWDDKEFRKIID